MTISISHQPPSLAPAAGHPVTHPVTRFLWLPAPVCPLSGPLTHPGHPCHPKPHSVRTTHARHHCIPSQRRPSLSLNHSTLPTASYNICSISPCTTTPPLSRTHRPPATLQALARRWQLPTENRGQAPSPSTQLRHHSSSPLSIPPQPLTPPPSFHRPPSFIKLSPSKPSNIHSLAAQPRARLVTWRQRRALHLIRPSLRSPSLSRHGSQPEPPGAQAGGRRAPPHAPPPHINLPPARPGEPECE
jgi:hypothetical protein